MDPTLTEQPDDLEAFFASLRKQAGEGKVQLDPNLGLAPSQIQQDAPPVPESDISTGRPLGANSSPPMDRMAPLPQPVARPPQNALPVRPSPVPEAPPPALPTPAPLDTYKRDPNEVLREAYKPAIDMALEARKLDLARQTSPMSVLAGGNREVAGMLTRNPMMAAQGAKQMNDALYSAVHGPSLEQAGRSGQEIAKAQLLTQDLDPNSDKAKSARLAFHSSDQFNAAAKNMADTEKISEVDARSMLYNNTKNLTAVGMDAFTNVMKSSNDYSKGRMEIAKGYAEKRQYEATTAKIQEETRDAKTLHDAWNNQASGISHAQRELYRSLLRPEQVAANPKFDTMTAHELAATYPTLAQQAADLLKWHQDYQVGLTRDTMVDNEWVVNSDVVPSATPGILAKSVANPIGVENKGKFKQQLAASKAAMDAGAYLLSHVTPGTALDYSSQDSEGVKVHNALKTFARNFALVSPSGARALEQIENTKPQGTFNPSPFIFGAGGKKSGIAQMIREMHEAMKMNSDPYTNTEVQVMGKAPATPPTYLPVETVRDVDKAGKKHDTYVYQIGGKKYQYFMKPNGSWGKQEYTQ